MVERLTALDASFLYLDAPDAPMHVAGVLVLETPAGGLEALARLVSARLAFVPRYRQRVLEVPGNLANPVWADDPEFDVEYHVRRSGLPRPGTEAQLCALVSRVTSQPLDRARPLWELYLVDGLAGDRVAVITKTHPALVDGLSAIDIGQVLLDQEPDPSEPAGDDWHPRPLPAAPELVWQALEQYARRPSSLLDTARDALSDVRTTTARVSAASRGLLRAARSAVLAAPRSSLNVPARRQRRVAIARLELDGLKRLRGAFGGGTVNDVLLAVVTGALREFLLSRGQAVISSTSIRALVPVSVQGSEDLEPGPKVSSFLVDLPVGEPNPRMRLTRISYAMRGVAAHGQAVGADSLIALTGFAPPTLHALGARAARGLSRRLFNLVVTNVPGPQVPLYAAGARMLEVFPVVPLARGQGLSIGMTSYAGRVFVGLNADQDGVGDVDVLADLIEQELDELLGSVA
jgi:diacylglycerol O-acyltransferase / wax synthase